MQFEREDIRHLGDLAKMKLSESEIDLFQKEINAILGFVNKLEELDVANVEPLYQLNGAETRSGADVAEDSSRVSEIRDAFPEETPDHYLAVHAVFTHKSED